MRSALIAFGAVALFGVNAATAAAAGVGHDRPTDRCVLTLPQPGARSVSCEFTAASIDNIYVLGPATWQVTVQRGDQQYRYGSVDLANSCFLSPNGFTGQRVAFCSDRIRRGDRVAATLYSAGSLVIGTDPVCESLFWCRRTI